VYAEHADNHQPEEHTLDFVVLYFMALTEEHPSNAVQKHRLIEDFHSAAPKDSIQQQR
jgi:hypothetical protein